MHVARDLTLLTISEPEPGVALMLDLTRSTDCIGTNVHMIYTKGKEWRERELGLTD